MSQNCGKVHKGGSALKIKKSTIQNVDYFETRSGGLDFQIFPKFKWLKYGLDFDNIWVTYRWDIGKIWYIWSNFTRSDIDKMLCHFFMVNESSLLALILHEIAWAFFLLSKLKLCFDYNIKNRHRVSQKNFERPLFLAIFLIFTF